VSHSAITEPYGSLSPLQGAFHLNEPSVDVSRLEASLRRVAAGMHRLLKVLRYSPRGMPAATRLWRAFVTTFAFTPPESLRGEGLKSEYPSLLSDQALSPEGRFVRATTKKHRVCINQFTAHARELLWNFRIGQTSDASPAMPGGLPLY
jgi:hypothetical protein